METSTRKRCWALSASWPKAEYVKPRNCTKPGLLVALSPSFTNLMRPGRTRRVSTEAAGQARRSPHCNLPVSTMGAMGLSTSARALLVVHTANCMAACLSRTFASAP